ncbi:MAG: ABC transporter ATP-binding protein [Chloroflexota bacterium]
MTEGPLLRVRDLAVEFGTGAAMTRPLDGISFEVGRGEVVGIVGETGCGKTLTGLSILGILPAGAVISRGSIDFDGVDLASLPSRELERIRGRRIAMVFQNPATALNPVFTIRTQIEHVVRRHLELSGRDIRDHVRETLVSVGLPETERVLRSYPHQLSGGMLQRAMIAMALSCGPELLIADEPTTALDVTIGAQVLDLLRRLQESRGFSVVFVTHDLGVVRTVTDRVVVLYAGRVAEEAPTTDLLRAPLHPYSEGLIGAVPRPDRRGRALAMIPGSVPTDPARIAGCVFVDRCPIVIDRCRVERPLVRPVGAADRLVACHLAGERTRRVDFGADPGPESSAAGGGAYL